MPFLSIGQIFSLARDTQGLFSLQAKMKDGLTALDERLRGVEDRLTRLEAEQRHVVSEAKSAATSAATMIASAVIAEAVTRVTRIEEALRRLEHPAPLRLVGDAATAG
jgi:hypothetical protein